MIKLYVVRILYLVQATILIALNARSQSTKNPFPNPIPAVEGVITVRLVEFAAIPFSGEEAPRLMLLVNEPGTHRLFVNTMKGPIYSVSYDGKTVTPYLDINGPEWGVNVQSFGHDRGFQSFAFHPDFNRPGARGYGKFYTYTDSANMTAKADFLPNGEGHAHDTVLLEWTAKNPEAATYDGGAPRELFRTAKPFSIHNGGQIAFRPQATHGSEDYGLLYVGVADGGSGGDPYKHAQNLSSAFGKILRIDPLGSNSPNGHYGIPATNPFVKNPKPGALGEIYAYGCRNPQRFSWDAKNGNMFLADIGQDVIEKVTLVRPGANLGWSIWEGSFTYGPRQVGTENPRGDPAVTYPIVEFDHTDPLFQGSVAITGIVAYRDSTPKQLTNKLLFGDNPSGEIFYVDADNLPQGGQDSIRRILFDDKGTTKTLLQLIQEKNKLQGRTPATRTDMRFNLGQPGKLYVMNKADGTIRLLVP
ncbi:MAG: PQQ-dependent sugar dehydrogenase [Acidobacteriota bacterium]|nr:PQQ-dependent sugar dehydrogenase [Acidobacteriota bacterium]